MINMSSIKMTTTVDRKKLLETLKSNLERHTAIVQEAKNGYIEKAKKALEKKLNQLKENKIVSLTFTLYPPTDYSEIYKSAIQMLEWNSSESVELHAGEFRQLVQDEWDWTDSFLASSMQYSNQAFSWLNEKSGGNLVAPSDFSLDMNSNSFSN